LKLLQAPVHSTSHEHKKRVPVVVLINGSLKAMNIRSPAKDTIKKISCLSYLISAANESEMNFIVTPQTPRRKLPQPALQWPEVGISVSSPAGH
jgi:hypothetical protein